MPLLAAGSRFPGARLPDLGGHERPLAEAWAQGPALLVVGHGDCGTTRLALPYVDRIHTRRAARATVLAVLQEDAAGARALLEQLGLQLTAFLDPEPYTLSAALGIATVPTLFHVDGSGTVISVLEGFQRDAFEGLALALGAAPPLFTPEDQAPPLRPG